MSEPLQPVVILAAGRGMRLKPFTDERPKALIPVAGKTIVSRIMDAFRAGFPRCAFTVVVGYRGDAFRTVVPPDGCTLEIIENTQWERSNSMLSLSLAASRLDHGGFIVEGDCCFDRELLWAVPGGGRASCAPDAAGGTPAPQAHVPTHSYWLARPFTLQDDGCCLRSDEAGRIHQLTIEKPGTAVTAWKSAGVLYVTPELGQDLAGWLKSAVAAGRQNQYYDLIVADHLGDANLHVADIGAAPWCEIDNAEDWKRAESIFGAA